MDSLVGQVVEGWYRGGAIVPEEVEIVRQHIATAGFDPAALDRIDRRVEALGYPIGSLCSTEELHYLRHVVAQQEWPAGTTQAEYVQSLRELVLDPNSRLLVSQYRHYGRHVSVVGRSGNRRGAQGFEWCMVEYRVATGRWVTAFQLRDGLSHFAKQTRQGARWVQDPT